MTYRPPYLPMWMRKDWLPELEVISWPRLDHARSRHHELLRELTRMEAAEQLVRERFAREDREAESALLEAARATEGVPQEPVTTSERVRQAMLTAAAEKVGIALGALCDHVEAVTRDLLRHEHETQEAIKAIHDAVGVPPTRPLGELPDSRNMSEDDIAELNREAEEINRRVLMASSDPRIRQLEADRNTLQGLFLTTLSASGDNILSELGQARAGIAA